MRVHVRMRGNRGKCIRACARVMPYMFLSGRACVLACVGVWVGQGLEGGHVWVGWPVGCVFVVEWSLHVCVRGMCVHVCWSSVTPLPLVCEGGLAKFAHVMGSAMRYAPNINCMGLRRWQPTVEGTQDWKVAPLPIASREDTILKLVAQPASWRGRNSVHSREVRTQIVDCARI